MPRVAVIGGRGYTGAELLPLIQRHPEFELVAVGSASAKGRPVKDVVPGMDDSLLTFHSIGPAEILQFEADACVLALPNGAAGPYVEVIDREQPGMVIVDLGADYRFDSSWVYGQPERFGDRVAGARRISNPGCYATGAQLAVAPLLDRLASTPVVFGVSGYSGAGKKPSPKNDPEVLRDNLLPYTLVDHIHEREVSRHLGREIRFLPHVAPFFRGISLSIALELDSVAQPEELLNHYRAFYREAPLIEVWERIPEVREAQKTHRAVIGGFSVSRADRHRVSLVCVLDNLLKGAATQALQNLNLAFGLEPLAGIEFRERS